MAKMENVKPDNLRDRMREAESQLQNYRLQVKRHCNHRGRDGRGRVESVSNTKIYIPEKHRYPASAVICTDCKEIFDLNPLSREDLDNAMFDLQSMLDQIQMVADLSDDDQQRIIEEGFESLDKLNTFRAYYEDMIKKLRDQRNGGNNNRQKSNKGGFGVTSNMFNSGR